MEKQCPYQFCHYHVIYQHNCLTQMIRLNEYENRNILAKGQTVNKVLLVALIRDAVIGDRTLFTFSVRYPVRANYVPLSAL